MRGQRGENKQAKGKPGGMPAQRSPRGSALIYAVLGRRVSTGGCTVWRRLLRLCLQQSLSAPRTSGFRCQPLEIHRRERRSAAIERRVCCNTEQRPRACRLYSSARSATHAPHARRAEELCPSRAIIGFAEQKRSCFAARRSGRTRALLSLHPTDPPAVAPHHRTRCEALVSKIARRTPLLLLLQRCQPTVTHPAAVRLHWTLALQ